ncbi:ABC transporter permease [Paenibacillus humicola]|uniref:ABC transporter permease n=1 Tax=Paenibacillus humicola TaxID=3110540 RepID=UPI00237B9D6B|nr:ABC transporter permease [Paenibacillus humicola]
MSTQELWSEMLVKSWQHLYLSGAALALAILVALPAGILLTRVPRVSELIMNVVGMIQTIPSLAMLALMIPLIGIGTKPTIAALFFYALLPIMRSTYTGVRSIPPAMIEAGKGMGMTSLQLLFKVEIPACLPVILSGIRISSVMVVGWATLGAYIGAGGLGDLIMAGFTTLSNRYILAGGIPVTVIALAADAMLGFLGRKLNRTEAAAKA